MTPGAAMSSSPRYLVCIVGIYLFMGNAVNLTKLGLAHGHLFMGDPVCVYN